MKKFESCLVKLVEIGELMFEGVSVLIQMPIALKCFLTKVRKVFFSSTFLF